MSYEAGRRSLGHQSSLQDNSREVCGEQHCTRRWFHSYRVSHNVD